MVTIMKCFLLTCLLLVSIFFNVAVTQDFGYADHSLTLTGPDEEGMLTCSMPIPLPLDTHVKWYVNGQVLEIDFLPHNTARMYESIQDLADQLGDYPTTVQCVIEDDVINDIPVISNKLTIAQE